MDGITEILSIVMLVFGILQIVLFFKVWGMTNDVHTLANAINERDFRELNLPKEAKIKGQTGKVDVIGMKGGKVLCRDRSTSHNELTFNLSDLIFDKD